MVVWGEQPSSVSLSPHTHTFTVTIPAGNGLLMMGRFSFRTSSGDEEDEKKLIITIKSNNYLSVMFKIKLILINDI